MSTDPSHTAPTAVPRPDAAGPDASHPNVVAVTAAAAALGLEIRPVTYPDGTRTAQDAADAIGCSVAQIVKSLIFAVVGTEANVLAADEASASGDEVVVALVSGANQLDEKRLAAAAGARKARRVDADRVRAATGFPIGGVPPFGHTLALRVFVDPDLLTFEEVWAAAGTPHAVFAVDPQRLVAVTGAVAAPLRRD